MNKEELKLEAKEYADKYGSKSNFDLWDTARFAYYQGAEPREKRIAELEAQVEKLIDFVLSKTECCDVCPITDTCINSEGTCSYAGILAKCEEEVTREWLMQFISKEIKENDRRTS